MKDTETFLIKFSLLNVTRKCFGRPLIIKNTTNWKTCKTCQGVGPLTVRKKSKKQKNDTKFM